MDKILKKASEETLRKVCGGGLITEIAPRKAKDAIMAHTPEVVAEFLLGLGEGPGGGIKV